MGLVDWLKEWYFQVTHSPNSPEGLRHRADHLVKKEGLSYQHPYVSALLKQADLMECGEK